MHNTSYVKNRNARKSVRRSSAFRISLEDPILASFEAYEEDYGLLVRRARKDSWVRRCMHKLGILSAKCVLYWKVDEIHCDLCSRIKGLVRLLRKHLGRNIFSGISEETIPQMIVALPLLIPEV